MNHPIIKYILFSLCLFGLMACSESTIQTATDQAESGSAGGQIEATSTGITLTGISPIPEDFPRQVRNNFDRYTQVIVPNGKPINIYAQDQISNAQITQVQNTLIFWLTDVPGSKYGADKTAVANQMGDNEATLMLLNGSDGDRRPPSLNAQPLYQTEIVVPGSAWYINNDFEHRDATFEEILHLVHDTGIGVDGENSQPGALPEFQAEIRAATNNAIANDFQIWPNGAASDRDLKSWYDELAAENSLSQEYLAAVIDSYYGLWGPFEEADAGMWGFYIAKTREDVQTKDLMGWALMERFFSPYLTYTAQLDSSFEGTFLMSFDPLLPYTHKSQYILNASLTGSNHSNLIGNDQDNELGGNSGDNVLNGMGGNNTAVYLKAESAYTVTHHDDGTIMVVGDGTDTLINIQTLRFADSQPEIAATSPEMRAGESGNSQQLPDSVAELETMMMAYLDLESEDDLFDYFDSLSDDEFLNVIQAGLELESPDEAEDLLIKLFEAEDDGSADDEPSLGIAVSETEIVSNGKLAFELQFMDQIDLPTGEAQPWNEAYKQPYIDAAQQWLSALAGVEGKAFHSIGIQITVAQFYGGNGAAGPTADERVGSYTFPTAGELIIGNHTYEEGFDQVEFKANILHEFGHIIGIGSYTEAFMRYDRASGGNIFRGPETNRGVEQYNLIYGTSVDFVPMSDDGGHLYDYVRQEDQARMLADGTPLPPLTKEFMANGHSFGLVTLGVLDDIGYEVDYSAAETYTP